MTCHRSIERPTPPPRVIYLYRADERQPEREYASPWVMVAVYGGSAVISITFLTWLIRFLF